jgi:DNA-binding transcriptional regulator YiaG
MKFTEWLLESGLKVEDFAYKLRSCRATVFKWQQGKFKPSKVYMEKLLKLTKGKVTKEDF